jgi:hypothetical protein
MVKTKVMIISGQPSTSQIIIDHKQLEDVEYSNCLGSMITNDARCTLELKIHHLHNKSSTQQEEDFSHQQIGLTFDEQTSKVLHFEHLDTSKSRSEVPGKF